MNLLQQKVNFMQRGIYDELYTPVEAVELILPYIPSFTKIIWECTAIEKSNITSVLHKQGYEVVTSHLDQGWDFLRYEPLFYDIIITNPPYSLKNQFLARAFELGKPFMFLLPLTALEGHARGEMYKKHHIQLIIPGKRFNFKPGKKGSWFQTSWFTYGLDLPKDLNFI